MIFANNGTEQFVDVSYDNLFSKYIEDNLCLICIGDIFKDHAIWSCICCYTSFHLHCIQDWVANGSYKNQNSIFSIFNKDVKWTCPKCRKEYEQNETPIIYKCYCGQKNNPDTTDQWVLPHSCGQICNRKFASCNHSCKILCHPGPCPPCPKTVNTRCLCGESSPRTLRCSKSIWKCDRICSKILNCSTHHCPLPCHDGECLACDKKSTRYCLCKRNKAEISCSAPDWKCDDVCKKPLSCSFHTCQLVCHSGPCSDCLDYSQGKRTCPCGKKGYTGYNCYEEVPCCGQTCDKLLACRLHTCMERCHRTPCGQCIHLSFKSCRCGSSKKSLPCHKEYTCDNKCDKLRNCGRHLCKRKCCDGNCNTCDQICGATLNCRKHKCMGPCHGGMCYPCPMSVTLSCDCGKTKRVIPCGNKRLSIVCKHLCKKPSKCHHKSIQTHACHFGDCPPCELTCEKSIAGCGHTCTSPCHDFQMAPISGGGDDTITLNENILKKRNAPWDPKIKYAYTKTDSPCPPCKQLVNVKCLGHHHFKVFECHEARQINYQFSCGSECGHTLACGNHKCSKICHAVTETSALSGSINVNTVSVSCQNCENLCDRPRPIGCTHSCDKVWCHHIDLNSTTTENGCPICRKMVKIDCYCGLNKVYLECVTYRQLLQNNSIDVQNDIKLSCQYQCPKLLDCGHHCQRKCHKAPCSDDSCDAKCLVKVKVYCRCKRIKRVIACHLHDKNQLPCNDYCLSQTITTTITSNANEILTNHDHPPRSIPGFIKIIKLFPFPITKKITFFSLAILIVSYIIMHFIFIKQVFT